jgi:hypothetical protein
VWCETLSFDELVRTDVLALVARHGVDVLLAVRPWQLDQIAEVVRRLQGAGVCTALWPMLADGDGRWTSTRSIPRFIAFTDELLARVPFVDELAIDLEPPFSELVKWKAWRPTWRQTPSPWRYHDARAALVLAVARWRRTRRITTAVLPVLAFEGRGEWMQRVLGTPATALDVERHSVMAYTSLFEGWSRGVVDRRRAETLLAWTARWSRTRFGARAALSLGTVGAGAFGDEPSYRDPTELARAVVIARTAGIAELSLFDLGGVVRRAPPEAWLAALTE